jgi:hypothetical protein
MAEKCFGVFQRFWTMRTHAVTLIPIDSDT